MYFHLSACDVPVALFLAGLENVMTFIRVGREPRFPRNGRIEKKRGGMGRCYSVPKHFILPLQGEVNANSLPVENLSIQHPQVSAGRSDNAAVICLDSMALTLHAVRRAVCERH